MKKQSYKVDFSKIPVAILCGGKGMRMGSEDLPKPLFKVGGEPILWHIMKIYNSFGCKNFILLLGYKKEKIIEYFKNNKEWNIKFLDTGLNTNTGGRIKRAQELIKSDFFFATYGDGLANLNLRDVFNFHLRHKKIATLTSVRPYSPFGIMSIDSHTNIITHFQEKPVLDHWVNGGFFIFSQEVFRYIKADDVLERDTLIRLTKNRELVAYKHNGFWECMDTYKDNLLLNQLWNSDKAPWAFWLKKKNL